MFKVTYTPVQPSPYDNSYVILFYDEPYPAPISWLSKAILDAMETLLPHMPLGYRYEIDLLGDDNV